MPSKATKTLCFCKCRGDYHTQLFRNACSMKVLVDRKNRRTLHHPTKVYLDAQAVQIKLRDSARWRKGVARRHFRCTSVHTGFVFELET